MSTRLCAGCSARLRSDYRKPLCWDCDRKRAAAGACFREAHAYLLAQETAKRTLRADPDAYTPAQVIGGR